MVDREIFFKGATQTMNLDNYQAGYVVDEIAST